MLSILTSEFSSDRLTFSSSQPSPCSGQAPAQVPLPGGCPQAGWSVSHDPFLWALQPPLQHLSHGTTDFSGLPFFPTDYDLLPSLCNLKVWYICSKLCVEGKDRKGSTNNNMKRVKISSFTVPVTRDALREILWFKKKCSR